MVLDVGGGTTDIVVYGLDEAHGGLKELVPGTGGICGGSSIDAAFYAWLRSRVPQWDQIIDATSKQAEAFRGKWEAAKRSFTGQEVNAIALEVPLALARAIRASGSTLFGPPGDDTDDTIVLSTAEMRSFYDPTLREIQLLAEEKLMELGDALPDKRVVILLVGGFVESKYLQTFLKRQLPAVEQYVPPNPGSAVAKGAAIFCLNPHIFVSRRARRSFGTRALRLWTPSDPVEREVELNGSRYVETFSTFVYMNQEIPIDAVVEHTYNSTNATDTEVRIPILSCKGFPKYPDDDGVTEVLSITVPLPQDRVSSITVRLSFGGTHIDVVAFSSAHPNQPIRAIIHSSKLI